jgi:hypothetical protein
VSIAETLVSNQFPKPEMEWDRMEIEHKVLIISTDDNRRLAWEESGGVRHRIYHTMTLMPTSIAVGVSGHGTMQIKRSRGHV